MEGRGGDNMAGLLVETRLIASLLTNNNIQYTNIQNTTTLIRRICNKALPQSIFVYNNFLTRLLLGKHKT